MQRIAAVQAFETEVRLVEVLAIRRVSTPALTAVAAGLVGEHDMIAALDTLHALADLLHHARALMTQHHRVGCPVPVVAEVYIGMADARGDDAHQDFVVSRTFQLEGFDLQGAALLAQNCRLNLVHLYIGMASHCSAPCSQLTFYFMLLRYFF